MNWYASKSAGDHQGLVIEEGTGRTVAVAYDKEDTASLAAAPAMLELLKEYHRRMRWHCGNPNYPNVTALIRKTESLFNELEEK